MTPLIKSCLSLALIAGLSASTSVLGKGSEAGLFGQVYEGTAEPSKDSKPKETRVDKQLAFKAGITGASLSKNFMVRWTGFIEIPADGDYVFVMKSDDGARMSINGKMFINNWDASGVSSKTGEARLKKGSVPILVEYKQADGGAMMLLGWTPPGGKRGIIPASAFTHNKPEPPKPEVVKPPEPEYVYLQHGKNPDARKSPRGTGAKKNPDAPPAEHFKVEVLSPELFEPMEMIMLPTGNILLCERKGELREYNPKTRETRLVIKLPVHHGPGYGSECGFLGLVADPNFKKNNYLYFFYSVKGKEEEVNRLSRFTYKDGNLDLASEVKILDVPTDRGGRTCHEAGSMAFGPDGLLYLSTGDNTNPFWKDASPMNPKKKEEDARRSAGNTADLRGAVLRLKINKDGSYDIPEGNLFKPGTPKTRPEIYTMGLRNPYRITINQKTGTLYWGEVSPDKNPTGEEINRDIF